MNLLKIRVLKLTIGLFMCGAVFSLKHSNRFNVLQNQNTVRAMETEGNGEKDKGTTEDLTKKPLEQEKTEKEIDYTNKKVVKKFFEEIVKEYDEAKTESKIADLKLKLKEFLSKMVPPIPDEYYVHICENYKYLDGIYNTLESSNEDQLSKWKFDFCGLLRDVCEEFLNFCDEQKKLSKEFEGLSFEDIKKFLKADSNHCGELPLVIGKVIFYELMLAADVLPVINRVSTDLSNVVEYFYEGKDKTYTKKENDLSFGEFIEKKGNNYISWFMTRPRVFCSYSGEYSKILNAILAASRNVFDSYEGGCGKNIASNYGYDATTRLGKCSEKIIKLKSDFDKLFKKKVEGNEGKPVGVDSKEKDIDSSIKELTKDFGKLYADGAEFSGESNKITDKLTEIDSIMEKLKDTATKLKKNFGKTLVNGGGYGNIPKEVCDKIKKLDYSKKEDLDIFSGLFSGDRDAALKVEIFFSEVAPSIPLEEMKVVHSCEEFTRFGRFYNKFPEYIEKNPKLKKFYVGFYSLLQNVVLDFDFVYEFQQELKRVFAVKLNEIKVWDERERKIKSFCLDGNNHDGAKVLMILNREQVLLRNLSQLCITLDGASDVIKGGKEVFGEHITELGGHVKALLKFAQKYTGIVDNIIKAMYLLAPGLRHAEQMLSSEILEIPGGDGHLDERARDFFLRIKELKELSESITKDLKNAK